MRHALGLAARGLGNVAPNPAVGCVIARGNIILGHGWTQPGGRPHAETEALAQAGDAARGATAYVTLEPCAHHGKTPPCVDALIEAGIRTVFVAATDPDPRTAGQGVTRLQDAGIDVRQGLCEPEALHLNRGFISTINRQLPWVTLKLATSGDGMIAWKSGTPQWITSEASRKRVHLMRARYDALVSGIGTVLADDPAFTCRLPGLDHQTPQRVILDRQGRTPVNGKLVASADLAEVFIVTTDAGVANLAAVQAVLGDDAIKNMGEDIDIEKVLKEIAKYHASTRFMVECGTELATSMLAGGHVDEVAWFRAPSILGDDGIPALAGQSVEQALSAGGFAQIKSEKIVKDVLATYVKGAY
jgi:diaminohydroxyphosphoribosylaminopyrimidine deaminase/5-amino-6-(5-phosphoribosylamino)uracil reductase